MKLSQFLSVLSESTKIEIFDKNNKSIRRYLSTKMIPEKYRECEVVTASVYDDSLAIFIDFEE